MKKFFGYCMVVSGVLLGVPGVLLCFTIVGIIIGAPMVLVGAALAIVGLHVAGHDTDHLTRKLHRNSTHV